MQELVKREVHHVRHSTTYAGFVRDFFGQIRLQDYIDRHPKGYDGPMKQKNARPNKRQAELLRLAGCDPRYYTVVRDLINTMMIRDRRDGTVHVLDKRTCSL